LQKIAYFAQEKERNKSLTRSTTTGSFKYLLEIFLIQAGIVVYITGEASMATRKREQESQHKHPVKLSHACASLLLPEHSVPVS
jgi:hypothetical protein